MGLPKGVGERRSRRADHVIISIFAVIVMSVPIGLVARAKFGEPYPWLFQPSFGYVINEGGELHFDDPTMIAKTDAGDETIVDIEALMPDVRTNKVLLFVNNFRRDEVVKDPETARWLTTRLDELYPGRKFIAVTITWSRETVHVATGERAHDAGARSITIRLDEKG